jgi:hypothetical protein
LQASDLPGLTDAILDTIHINQETPISTVVVSGNTVTIAGIFSSNDNEADYYANTLLLIGSYNGQEFVAGASIATGQAMRIPAAGNENTEFTVRPQIVVSNSSTISTTVNPIAGATNERVDNEVAQLQSQIDTINDTNDTQDTTIAGKVSKTLNETVDGIKTFVKTIVGNITGNAGSATKLQTARTIGISGDATGSASFDGSDNATIAATLASVTRTDTTSTESKSAGQTFTAIDDLTTDAKGRVTAANVKTVTLPAIQTSVSGNAGSATKLQTARTINGSPFDGTANISVNAANDAQLVHTSGAESIAGQKTFTDGISTNNLVVSDEIMPTKETTVNIGWGQTIRLTRVGNMVFINAADQIINGFGPLYSSDITTQDETLPSGYRPSQEFDGNATKIVTGNIKVNNTNHGAYWLMFQSNGTIQMTRERDNPTGNVYVTLQTGFWFTDDQMPS